jgi:hypothetical protein
VLVTVNIAARAVSGGAPFNDHNRASQPQAKGKGDK